MFKGLLSDDNGKNRQLLVHYQWRFLRFLSWHPRV